MVPFLRGRHSVEEIMWRENLSRTDVAALLSSYHDVLVESWHELVTQLTG